LVTIPIRKSSKHVATINIQNLGSHWVVDKILTSDTSGEKPSHNELDCDGAWTELTAALVAASECVLTSWIGPEPGPYREGAIADVQSYRRKLPGCENFADFIPEDKPKKRRAAKKSAAAE
jgi:hypothetical protein